MEHTLIDDLAGTHLADPGYILNPLCDLLPSGVELIRSSFHRRLDQVEGTKYRRA